MTADLKMKQTSKYPKESTLQFYAKKGMTVHGVMAQRWRRQQGEDGKWYSFLEKVYIDVVVENGTKQDKAYDLTWVEAKLSRLKVSGSLLLWLKIFLSRCILRVRINSTLSSCSLLRCL